jgi:uncharacterized protein (UPF0332 family)
MRLGYPHIEENDGLKRRAKTNRTANRRAVKPQRKNKAVLPSAEHLLRAHLLQRAKEQCDEAAVHSWEPEEPADCVTKCFYSYENAVSAVGAFLGLELPDNHDAKATFARQFANQHKLRTDIHDRLIELNQLRKDVSYGEPGPELANFNLKELVNDLETFLEEVEQLIQPSSR